MNIKDLKIGDKVKFISLTNENEGYILNIEGNKFLIKSHFGSYKVDKTYIISKLEPYMEHRCSKYVEYEEIPIEKEYPAYLYPKCHKEWEINFATEVQVLQSKYCALCNKGFAKKETIKISDLKIGDKIRYKTLINGSPGELAGEIYAITDNYIFANCTRIEKSNILCKVEERKTERVEYEEIPIEKEEIDFKKELDERLKLINTDDVAKQEPAPKSFKFDYEMSGHDLWIPENIRVQMGFRVNKTYTIEIKEKE